MHSQIAKTEKGISDSFGSTRIGETVKLQGLSYNGFIHNLKVANIDLDRKSLAHLVTEHPEAFAAVVDENTNGMN